MWAAGQAGNTESCSSLEKWPCQVGKAVLTGMGCLCVGVYSGRFQTGRSLRAQSQEQPLVSQGTWELESRQGDPEPPVFPGYLCPGATPQHSP